MKNIKSVSSCTVLAVALFAGSAASMSCTTGASVESKMTESPKTFAWANCEKVGDSYINASQMVLMFIPAGEFVMGSPVGEKGHLGDETQHKVTLTHAFLMGKTPVTQAQYQAVMGSNPSAFQGDANPVEKVSWDDARSFCAKLTEKGRAEGKLPKDWGYRLPTEAEWEYACRAGTTGSRYGELGDIAWYSANSNDTTHPVGAKQANAWGLHDMIGNVYQWCEDGHTKYSDSSVTDPRHEKGICRVLRGACLNVDSINCRAASRSFMARGGRSAGAGFRIVLTSVSLNDLIHPLPHLP